MLAAFGDKTRVNSNRIPMPRVFVNEELIGRYPVKSLSEILTESLLARFAIACQLKKIYSSADG